MIALLLLACAEPGFTARSLEPGPNPFDEDARQWAPQPHRDHPLEVAARDGVAWVSLQGSEDAPGDRVARVDLATGKVRRVRVGSSPTGVALHPGGRYLLVTNRYSNWASVVDTRRGAEVRRIPTDFYAIEAAFSPDGGEVWVTNRWRDTVEVWTVDPSRRLAVVARASIPVGVNPRDVAISADGATVAVATPTGLSVTLIDAATRAVRAEVDVGAPANGLAFVGPWLVVATQSRSTHHFAHAGPDTNGDGEPGDGTPNVNFQDLQNELAVIDARTGEEAWRYTSDTICCKDWRDVDPRDLERRGDLLPPEDTWIVGGAVPEQVAASDNDVYVAYSGSNELQRFALDPDTGALTAGPVWPTPGHAPHGIAVDGGQLLVVHRLGETLGVLDPTSGEVRHSWVVGDVSGGDFPATDAEIGELVNSVTAPYGVDGDQACTSCHRERGNIDKAFSMPLTRVPGVGSRMPMAYRGAFDTRPWFFEAAMDEGNFLPVLNEFARAENFCCTDPTLWPGGPPDDCEADPPPECDAPGPWSPTGMTAARPGPFQHPRPTDAPSRDAWFTRVSGELVGRTESFGDGLFHEDPITGDRRPVRLDFGGVTRALGLFLAHEPGLLPNPNPETASVRRGRALFEGLETGCATCHPAPAFAASTDVNPFGVPLRMGPVVTPDRDDDGVNLDLLASGFLDAFPRAEQDACEDVCDPALCADDPSACDDLRDVFFGVTSLRGIWDRAPSMLHHGRAQGLREVLATPGHPVLRPGELGFNERDGVPDTHGGTSHLTADEVEDLVRYLETL